MKKKKVDYQEVMDLCKDYNETFDKLYKLNTFSEVEIDKIYESIKTYLLDTQICTPSSICETISALVHYRIR
ncbi:hypothetical protein TVAG_476750 [Trichomonas vaginalis G3]|uniref:Uncharacterized protein n=1 Tax=Trichomonas vaginalis (strain ATCC PRA-98 / G3) TaxID=412133 RepID=A2DA98_TRIV3|nr:protein of unknown function (DUF3447) [Trichomonas vaginalis G3]EAY22746.1 hypothetical protein TVAG_476750 [Trichomonas vaginalis G3]KAI5525557.1 protein of unknown function (DUF3447) [Trichomonas vaginalis G3]|eukprot:XP_001583732.1 hypothetical protein [Trichomonas vaginalis G3]